MSDSYYVLEPRKKKALCLGERPYGLPFGREYKHALPQLREELQSAIASWADRNDVSLKDCWVDRDAPPESFEVSYTYEHRNGQVSVSGPVKEAAEGSFTLTEAECKLVEEALGIRICLYETGTSAFSYEDYTRMDEESRKLNGLRLPSREQLSWAEPLRALRQRLFNRNLA